MPSYTGVIIEESLEDKSVLNDVKITETKTIDVTPKHETPWVKQWTLHTVGITEPQAEDIAQKLSKVLDSKHNWYADFKNNTSHYFIFQDKVFKIDRSKEEYGKVAKYGISLGIPDYQLDFSADIKQ